MKKIEKLTKEQKLLLPIYRQHYLDLFFNSPKIADKREVTEYMHWFYSTFNISENKKPKIILVNSPFECLIAHSLLEKFYKLKETTDGMTNEVGNEMENEVRNEVWNEMWNEMRNEMWNEVGNEVAALSAKG